MGELWWSEVRCPNDGQMMSARRSKCGNYEIFCERCWDSFVSSTSDGRSPLKERDTLI